MTKSGLTDVAYVYDRNAGGTTDGNSGGWRTTDGSVGDLHDGIIAPMQGFFVQNSGSSPSSLTFEEANQTEGGEFYGKETDDHRSVLRFQLSGEGLINSSWLTFSESGNLGLMPGDALELAPFSDDFATLAFNKSDGQLLDIAQFPADASLEIPFHAESTVPGVYTIEITDFDLAPGIALTLIDRETGDEISIHENFRYEFEIQGFMKKNPLSVQCSDLHESMNKFQPTAQKAMAEHRFSIHVQQASAGPNELPSQTSLDQNFPNPFNPSTVIRYTLAEAGDVRLEVYDMLGRRVATLVEGAVSAGSHMVTFDASGLNSGAYFYRLSTQNRVFSRQMLLIK